MRMKGREVVVLTGETARRREQRLLAIIRTDAGGFFGLGEHEGPTLHRFEGRFAHILPPERPAAKARDLARAMLAAMGVTEDRLLGNAERN